MDKIIYCKRCSIFIKDNKYGLLNDIEEIIVPPVYDNIFIETYSYDNMCEVEIVNGFYKNGIAKVKKDNLYGYIDEYGREILECKYNEAYMINRNLFCVKLGLFWTIVNEANELKLPLLDDIYYRWYDGNYTIRKSHDIGKLAIYKKHNKLGLLGVIDANNVEVLAPPIFDEINMEELHSGNLYVPVRQSDKWGIINKYGDIILECVYDKIVSWDTSNYSEEWNEAYHKQRTKKSTSIDETPSDILEQNDFTAYVMINRKYGIVSAGGITIVPITYNSIEEAKRKRVMDIAFPYY